MSKAKKRIEEISIDFKTLNKSHKCPEGSPIIIIIIIIKNYYYYYLKRNEYIQNTHKN